MKADYFEPNWNSRDAEETPEERMWTFEDRIRKVSEINALLRYVSTPDDTRRW